MPLNARSASNEAYEVHDSPTSFTTRLRQRQQQAACDPASSAPVYLSRRPSSALDAARRLLRRSHQQEEDRPSSHRRAASANALHYQNRQSEEQRPRVQTHPAHLTPVTPGGIAALPPALSDAHTEGEESTVDDPYQLLDQSYWPQRTRGVSSRTSSAILWVLEEGIRKPFPFTPDWDELNASMSDLVGGTGPMLGSSGRTQNGTIRAAQGPVPVQSHQPNSGVRTPTDIMRQRRDREARKKAEQEARDKEQEAVERRRRQSQQSQVPTQQYAPGAAVDTTAQRKVSISRPPVEPGQQQQEAGATLGASPGLRQNVTAAAGAQQARSQGVPSDTGAQTQQLQAPPSNQSQQQRRSTFPHAFERWESLSSHWEGLTSYWIRKLEQNGETLNNDPLNQQMARQITDLSAAGANLFHAVVELQRLRASSERKFQRWFFDTRAEQERAKEVHAELERRLKSEQQARADALNSWQRAESEKKRSEELLKEMRRELQISKEEARRAWEELGRREQEERDRTQSLRNGEPTLVGGVQVVPMIQGFPSRLNTGNRPPTREGPYPGGPSASAMGGQGQGASRVVDPRGGGEYYEERSSSSTETDPFLEEKPPTSNAAEPQPGHFYRQELSAGHPGPATSELGEPSGASSEPSEEEYGRYGRHIVYPPTLSDESDDYASGEGPYVSNGGYVPGSMAPSSGPLYPGYSSGPVDYSGSGWGSEWESVTPRHRHPTRLSDVLEEDEPSRTTPSRASLASRSVQ